MKGFAGVFALGLAVVGAATAANEGFQNEMASCLKEQSQRVVFNGFVAARRADARFQQASGFADAQGKLSITRETPFRLASVGKVFTRVAIGTLMDAGKLKLDDSVRQHLPELPESFAPITLAQLLEHRSGVAPMTRPDMADGPAMAAAKQARDLVPLLAAKPLSFAPGSQEQYSNGGYLLLGAVIESASGEDYRSYVTRRLFNTLGMKASSFDPGPNARLEVINEHFLGRIASSGVRFAG